MYYVIDCQHERHPPQVTTTEGHALRLATDRGDARVRRSDDKCEVTVYSFMPHDGVAYRFTPAQLTPTGEKPKSPGVPVPRV